MAQAVIDITEYRNEGGVVRFKAATASDSLQAILLPSSVSTTEDLAKWLLAQNNTTTDDPTQDLRLTITFHTEIVQDEEGNDVSLRVFDSVVSEPLPHKKAFVDVESLPDWGLWSTTEAVDWIETNVTDLNSAKVVLKRLAEMVILEREVLKKLL